MKKVLPLLMAAVMVTASIPMAASASETGSTAQDAGSAESGTAGTDSAGVTGGTSGETGSAGGEDSAAGGNGGTTADGTGQTGADTDGTGQGTGTTDGTVTEDGQQTDGTADESADAEEEDTAEETEGNTDSGKVVTLGENLNEEQRASMYEYFGTSPDEVETIVVTHADEVQYMQGIATDEQIGPTTNSCAYVEPTDSGGIKVKTANLNFVTSAMIASTLTTAGMENCNVIAACPFEVSGTGALTGIIMAYETASGEELDEGQKEAAMEELVTTGDLADSVGQEKATEVIKDVKTEVIDEGLTDPEEIGDAVDNIAEENEITLTDDQRAQVVALMEKISQYDYDVNALKDTLDNLTGESGALSNIWNTVKTFFVGSDDGILSDTNDEALGSDVVTDSTVNESGFKDGLFTRIKNFFTGE
ncbi:DUF1002 domain-containing protein [Lachnoclostridium sp. An118]|uniref:DUF1002 domain-containing protein n=1 Tax=Lachnoclostridium sp. An118 TaxID=1965547 RepID=UPI001FA88F79|nr:DUF1002 domain-containing protein [Lachnoclostridium sp. An118]